MQQKMESRVLDESLRCDVIPSIHLPSPLTPEGALNNELEMAALV